MCIQLNHWHLNLVLSGAEISVEKLKNYKSPGTDQIPAELIQVG
jgi:hypothetical protein